MKKLTPYLLSILPVLILVVVVYFLPPTRQAAPVAQDSAAIYGSVNAVGGTSYYLYGSGVGSSDTSVTLTSFRQPVSQYPLSMNDFGDIGYLTLEPGNSNRQEFVSFANVVQNPDGTATLTGVVRGLAPVYPFTASSTIQKAHGGGTVAVLSNPPQFYERFANKANAQNITGVWTFASTSPPQYDAAYTASGNQFVSYNQLNNTAIQGAGTSTESALGLVQLSSAANVANGAASSSAGAPLVIENKFATTTPGVLCTGGTWRCIVASTLGKISQAWLDLTASFTFSGGITSTATTTLAGSNVLSNALKINTVPYQWPSSQGSTNSLLINNGSGVLSWGASLPKYNGYAAPGTVNNNSATTTLVTIPSGVLGTSSTIQFWGSGSIGTSGNCTFGIQDSGKTMVESIQLTGTGGGTADMTLSGIVVATSTASAQQGLIIGNSLFGGTVNAIKAGQFTSSSVYSTLNFASGMTLQAFVQSGSSASCTLGSFVVTVNP